MSDPEANAPPEPSSDAADAGAQAGLSTSESQAEPLAAPAPAPVREAEPDDPVFEALWAKVLASWDDDKIHSSALEYAVTSGKLPELAGRYRERKDDPAKAERAQKRLDAIILAATQMMLTMRTPSNTTVPLPITISVVGIFVAAVLFVAYAMIHR